MNTEGRKKKSFMPHGLLMKFQWFLTQGKSPNLEQDQTYCFSQPKMTLANRGEDWIKQLLTLVHPWCSDRNHSQIQ